MRDLSHFGDVDDFQRRIGRAFQKERLGVRLDSRAPSVEIAAVDQRRSDAEARQIILDDIAAGAEHRLRGDDVIARLHLADHGQRDRGHTGCRRARGFGAFKGRHAALEHVDGRIGETRILIARVFVLEALLRLGGAVVDVTLGEEQRFRGFAERRAQRSRLNQAGFRAVDFWCRRGHVCCSLPNAKSA